jgi:hypothetical protein
MADGPKPKVIDVDVSWSAEEIEALKAKMRPALLPNRISPESKSDPMKVLREMIRGG